ncbi:MAG: nucleotidyltransferase domain-containing protein [Armatimonadota bacterium]
MRPSQQQLDELVRRIVDAVHPLRIILFGSAARGEMGEDSDVDVMVVMPEGVNQHQTAGHLYMQFRGLGFPVDVLVATTAQIDRYADDIGFIYYDVLREGKDIYVAAA